MFIGQFYDLFPLSNQGIASFYDNSGSSGVNHGLQSLSAKAGNIEALVLRRLSRLSYNNTALALIATP